MQIDNLSIQNQSGIGKVGKIFLGLTFLGLAFGVGFWSSERLSPQSAQPQLGENLDLELFWEALALIDQHYLDRDQIEEKDLLYGAIAGAVEALDDPYTAFFTPEENEQFHDDLEGKYEGIGAQLGFRDEQLVVVAPLEGSPAALAGVRPGDAILAVDGESTTGWSLAKAVSEIRGDAGTSVQLLLPDQEVTVTRGEITVPAVRLTWIDNPDDGVEGKIAHLRVIRFGSDTIKEWDRLVREVIGQSVDGVVLDVRNNPGGFFNAAVYLASEFFADGVVVKKATNSDVQEFKIDHRCRLCNLPMVVLVNEGSASASEILAGAIQRRGRGELVGETTFGKGTVQESIELDENAALHITNAEWRLPDDTNITEQGLTPDIEVETEVSSGPFGNDDEDAQLQKAVEHLRSKL